MHYDFELEELSQELKSRNVKTILIQLPDGFKHYAKYILHKLKTLNPELKIYFSGNPSYGPCLIDEELARELGVDLIVHFGHLEYPYYKPQYPTLFIPVKCNLIPKYDVVRRLCRDLKSRRLSRVGVVATAQHIHILDHLCSTMERENIEALYSDVPILGCYYEPALRMDVDAYVVVAGGKFHALGLRLAKDATVYRLDPYENVYEDIEYQFRKVIRIRMWKIAKARDAKYWVVVAGICGQYRPNIIDNLLKYLRTHSYDHLLIKCARIDLDMIRNFGSDNTYIITSCPRVAIDDMGEEEELVLTPGEALMIFTSCERYIFPW